MAEGDIVHLLTEGFGLEEDHFLHPVPHTYLVVRLGTDRGQFAAISIEADLGVRPLGSLSHNPVEPERGVLVDIDVGILPLFSHSKVLLLRVDSDTTNASPVLAEEECCLVGEGVVDGVGSA